MKKLFVILIAVMLFSSCAYMGLYNRMVRESSAVIIDAVPYNILASYKLKYSGISTEKWFKVNRNIYAACFERNGKKTYTFFSNSGDFIDEDHFGQNNYDRDDDYMEDQDYFDNDIRD
jgi:uncharacterized protein YxeA